MLVPGRVSLVLACALTSLVLRGALPLAAQSPDPHAAQPERPTVATHAGTVAPGWLEIESGLELDRFRNATHAVGVQALLKLGVARRVQLSVSLPFSAPPGSGFGPADFAVGVKLRLLEKAGLLGDFAVFPALKLPTGSSESGRGSGTTDVSLLVISSHALGPVAVDLNAGITRRSGDGTVVPRTATVWTASFGGPGSGGLGWVAELFGYPATKGPAGSASLVALLAGPTYRFNPSLVLDVGGIVPLSGPQPKALYLGLTWNAGRYWPGGLRLSPSGPPRNGLADLRRSGK